MNSGKIELEQIASSARGSSVESLFDPHFIPEYHWLNAAIGKLTADMVAQDQGVFRVLGGDLRYVAERQMFFALFADRSLYEYFVALETGHKPNDESLTKWGRCIAPYYSDEGKRLASASVRPDLKVRLIRQLYRLYGRANIQLDGVDGQKPRVLFPIIHSKFIRYFRPIAERLSVPYAFVAIDDPRIFEILEAESLPRLHIEYTPESKAMMDPVVKVGPFTYQPGLFDSWAVKFNAIRCVFRDMRPECIVIPEGNADIYELINQSAKAARVPTLCIQQGWAPIVHPGFKNMSYTRMCVWGDGFSDQLEAENPAQSFVSTGNHNIQCREQGTLRNRRSIAFFLQNGAHWMTEKAWHSMLDLIKWTGETFPAWEIRVREHPGQPLTPANFARFVGPPNVKVLSPEAYNLSQALEGCRVVVAMNSTTILEAAATGAVPLILDVNGFGPYNPNIASQGAAIEVTDYENARLSLRHLLSDDEFCRSFAEPLDDVRRSFFARDGDSALDAIVREIDDLRIRTGGLKYKSRSKSPVLDSKNPIPKRALASPDAKPIVFLINQISSHGHLDMYARLYSRCFLDLGYRVVLIAERDAGVKNWIAELGWTSSDFDLFERDQLLEGQRPASSGHVEQAVPLPLFKRMVRVWKQEGAYGIAHRLMIYGRRPYDILRSIILRSLSRLRNHSNLIARIVTMRTMSNKGVDLRPIADEINVAALRIGAAPSFVFFLYLDMINESRASCRSLTRRMKAPWAGILFHPRCLENDAAKNVERYFKAGSSAGAAFLNPNAIKPYQAMFPGRVFGCLPDVTDASLPNIDPEIVKTLRARADGRTIVLALGSISPHKGVIDLIGVIGRLDPQKFFFALVGEVFWGAFGQDESKIRLFCNNPPENCLVQTGYIKDERDLNAAICGADILYAVYNDFKDSSNTLTKASIFKKPVIVSDEYLMGERVKNYRLGAVVKYGDLDAIAKSLASLADGASGDFGFDAYARDNSYRALRTSLGRLIERWIGKGLQTAASAPR